MTTTGVVCGSCGTQVSAMAKFCSECGAPIAPATTPAEYKQVTVLFADVVQSMDIAAAVGAERLREIMTELVTRAAAVVRRYGGTVDKFTGDGIMAVFGAPMALKDHAFRACLAALEIQAEATELAEEVKARDGIAVQLRVGLNSRQVIAGEIGSGALGYTAIGEHAGMAPRMESVAAPGGVILGASTDAAGRGQARSQAVSPAVRTVPDGWAVGGTWRQQVFGRVVRSCGRADERFCASAFRRRRAPQRWCPVICTELRRLHRRDDGRVRFLATPIARRGIAGRATE